jgi:hypothetical protein
MQLMCKVTLYNNVQLRAEFVELIAVLPYEEVRVVSMFTSGRSGSPVLLVDIIPKAAVGPEGKHVLKLARVSDKKNTEGNAHQQAKEAGFEELMPELIYSSAVSDPIDTGDPRQYRYCVLVYKIATESIVDSYSLHQLIHTNTEAGLPYVKLLADSLFALWQKRVLPKNVPATTARDLSRDYMLRTLATSGQSITVVAKETLCIGPEYPLLRFQGNTTILPNPIAYLEHEALWPKGNSVSFPLGPIHGDLHTENIVVGKRLPKPVIIDFAGFNPESCCFYDLLYLEMNLLLTLFQNDSLEQWYPFIDHLSKDWRSLEAIVPGGQAAVTAKDILQILRQPAYQLAQLRNRLEDFETAFHITAFAIGLNFMRKWRGISAEMQLKALSYSAYSLRRVLIRLDAFQPETDFIATPHPGTEYKALELQIKLAGAKWKDDNAPLHIGPLPKFWHIVDGYESEEAGAAPQDSSPINPSGRREKLDLPTANLFLLDYMRGKIQADEGLKNRVRDDILLLEALLEKERTDPSYGERDEERKKAAISRLNVNVSQLSDGVFSYTDVALGLYRTQPKADDGGWNGISATNIDIDLSSSKAYECSDRQARNLINEIEHQIESMSLIGSSVGYDNRYLLEQKLKITQKLNEAKEKTPIWMEITRECVPPATETDEIIGIDRTEKGFGISVSINNRGHKRCQFNYIEHLPPEVNVLKNDSKWKKSGTTLKYNGALDAGKSIVLQYLCSANRVGEFDLRGDVQYEGKQDGWWAIEPNSILCRRLAIPAKLDVTRNHFYRQDVTKILLRVVNKGESTARDLVFEESWAIDGQVHQVSLEPIHMLAQQDPPMIREYSIPGHRDLDTIIFNEENCVEYKDSEGKSKSELVEADSTLLEYPLLIEANRLASESFLRARDSQDDAIFNLIAEVDSRASELRSRILYVSGGRGTGKSTLLKYTLRRYANLAGYLYIEEKAQRGVNPFIELLCQLLKMGRGDLSNTDHVRSKVEKIPGLGSDEDRMKVTLLCHFMADEEVNDPLLVDAMGLVLKHAADQRPLVIVFDDAHEIVTRKYRDLLKGLLKQFVEAARAPIIFAFGETPEYIFPEVGSIEDIFPKRTPHILRLETEKLSQEDSYKLIDDLIPYPSVSKRAKNWIFKLSEGIPQNIYDILLFMFLASHTVAMKNQPRHKEAGDHSQTEVLELRGNHWTIVDWTEREDVKPIESAHILPPFVERYFEADKDVLRFLRAIAVVGEQIPRKLAIQLHQDEFGHSDPQELARKIHELQKIEFLKRDDEVISFTHLVRRNAIYDHMESRADLRLYRDRCREHIVEAILALDIYHSHSERLLQAAHHLSKDQDPAFQQKHASVMFDAAEVALRLGNLLLGTKFVECAKKLTTGDRFRLVDLTLMLARHSVDSAPYYEEALNYVDEAEALFRNIEARQGVTEEERVLYQSRLDRLRAYIMIERQSDNEMETLNYLTNAKTGLERLCPRRRLFGLLPPTGIADFPYEELIDVYAMDMRNTISDDSLKPFAREYNVKAILTKLHRLEQKINSEDTVLAIRLKMETAKYHSDRGEYDQAYKIYQDILKAIHRQKKPMQADEYKVHELAFFEGRTYQAMARLKIVIGLFGSALEPLPITPDFDEVLARFELPLVITNSQSEPSDIRQEARKIAEGFYEDALELHRKVGDRLGMAEAYVVLGLSAHSAADSAKALEYYNSARELYGELGNPILRWVCYLGELDLRLDAQESNTASMVWPLAYKLYAHYLKHSVSDKDYAVQLPHLPIFADLTSQLDISLQQEDWDLREHATEVQIRHLANIDPGRKFELYCRLGDLQLERTAKTADVGAILERAIDSYRQALNTAEEIQEIEFYISACRKVVEVLVYPEWDAKALPLSDDNVWTPDEAEYYLEKLCIVLIEKATFERMLGEAYPSLIAAAFKRKKNHHRFRRSYTVIAKAALQAKAARPSAHIEQLFEKTQALLQAAPTQQLVADLAVLSGKLLVRRVETDLSAGRKRGPSDDSSADMVRVANHFLEEAESRYERLGGWSLYEGLNWVYPVYLESGFEEGFGRCLVKLLATAVNNRDDERAVEIFTTSIDEAIHARKLSRAHLHEIGQLLDRLLKQYSNPLQSRDSANLTYRRAVISFHLGSQMLLQKDQAEGQYETKFALQTVVPLLESSYVSKSSIYNLLGVCLHQLGELHKSTIAAQASARTTLFGEDHEVPGIEFSNLAQNYLRLNLRAYASTLIHEAFKYLLSQGIQLDMELVKRRGQADDFSTPRILAEAVRTRHSLAMLIETWMSYILAYHPLTREQVDVFYNLDFELDDNYAGYVPNFHLAYDPTNTMGLLFLLERQRRMLYRQYIEPYRILAQPLFSLVWPLHEVKENRLYVNVELPPSEFSFEDTLNYSFEGVPDIDGIIAEIRNWDNLADSGEEKRP